MEEDANGSVTECPLTSTFNEGPPRSLKGSLRSPADLEMSLIEGPSHPGGKTMKIRSQEEGRRRKKNWDRIELRVFR